MQPFSREAFRELIDTPYPLCVSIFLPTERAGKETQQNPIRFKNLVRHAEDRIEREKLLRPLQAKELLQPAYALIQDDDFWQHQDQGLAFFLAPDFQRHYRVPIRFDELSLVDRQFYVKPLLRLLTGDGRFYVLALDRKGVRLWEASRFDVHEVDLGDTPRRFEDVVGYELEEQHLQFHTGAPPQTTSKASVPTVERARAGIFHGHGGGEDDVKVEIRKFFAAVDRGVRERLNGREAPLVLAGAEPLPPIYREVSTYPQLLEHEIRHHPADLRPDDMREKGWQIVEPVLRRDQEERLGRFRDLTGTGRTSDRLAEILPAVLDGRVEALFVARGARCWGRYDAERREVREASEPGNGNHDLLDQAAVQTLLHSGAVFVLEPDGMPGSGPIAALYRY